MRYHYKPSRLKSTKYYIERKFHTFFRKYNVDFDYQEVLLKYPFSDDKRVLYYIICRSGLNNKQFYLATYDKKKVIYFNHLTNKEINDIYEELITERFTVRNWREQTKKKNYYFDYKTYKDYLVNYFCEYGTRDYLLKKSIEGDEIADKLLHDIDYYKFEY